MGYKFLFISILSLLIFTFSCKSDQTTTTEEKKLGEVEFVITVNEEAKPLFEEGLMLLHSFEYDDAREAFLEAQEKDPDCVMAYWGEAMTYNHTLWSEQEYEEGMDALQKLAETQNERLTKAKTEIEKEFLQGVELLYQPQIEKKQRDKNYAAHMESMQSKYPNNHEVAAFHALSLLGAVDNERRASTLSCFPDLPLNSLFVNR